MPTHYTHVCSAERLFREAKNWCSLKPTFPCKLHKGQRGRIGVIGGSVEYTGAPFFAAYAAECAGADIAHVFCHPAAAQVIKGYSPTLIVHPLFQNHFWTAEERDAFRLKLSRLDVVILGPGCGQSSAMTAVAEDAIRFTKEQEILLVADADAFRLPYDVFAHFQSHTSCILTPNLVELNHLDDRVNNLTAETQSQKRNEAIASLIYINLKDPNTESIRSTHITNETLSVATKAAKAALQLNVRGVLVKGFEDVITDGVTAVIIDQEGSMRRCGGQGDILTGAIAALLASASFYYRSQHNRASQAGDRHMALLEKQYLCDILPSTPEDAALPLSTENFPLILFTTAVASWATRKAALTAETQHKGCTSYMDQNFSVMNHLHSRLSPFSRVKDINALDILKELGSTLRQLEHF